VPAIDRQWQRRSVRRWERWHAWQSAGRPAEFTAAEQLRR
jgi:hypothetical protein